MERLRRYCLRSKPGMAPRCRWRLVTQFSTERNPMTAQPDESMADISMQDMKDSWQEEQRKARQALGDQLMASQYALIQKRAVMAGNQDCAQQTAFIDERATANNSVWSGRKFWDKIDRVFRIAVSI